MPDDTDELGAKNAVEAVLAGDAARAIDPLDALCAAEPSNLDAQYWLATALLANGEGERGRQVLDAARTTHALAVMRANGADLTQLQNDPAYAALVGRQLYEHRLVAVAGVAFGAALAHGLALQELLPFALSLQHQGRADEAIAAFRTASEIARTPAVHQHLLFALFFGTDGVRNYPAEARRWAALHVNAPASARRPYRNPASHGRKLRVGYVAPSFTGSQLKWFVLPVLEAHDPSAVRLHLYSADAKAEAGLPTTAVVRSIGALSDEAAVAAIRADGIDVLVDLWGHTAGSRLSMFAHRPAPVQVAACNFVQTTGLDAIDYVLHADSFDAPGTAELFVEQVWPVGPVAMPYRPPEGRPGPSLTPALRNGYVTFGSFNNPSKLSEQTVRAWSRILVAKPDARLLLKYGYFADPVLQRVTQARFAACGVAPERIVFRGHSAGPDYLREFADVDLALDPSPCPGGTTTCDAIAHGVPVLTLRGPDFYSRIGVCAAEACDCPELIAESWDDYVERAVALTADVGALDQLRRRVREGFDRGPFRDEVGFTRRLEGAFREMFDRWRAQAHSRRAA